MTSTQVLFPFNESLSKSNLQALALASIDALLDGGNPIEVAEAIKAMEEFVDLVKKNDRFKNYLLDELRLHPKGYTTPNGTKIEEIETAVSYDYSHNPEWVDLDKTIATLDVKRKALEGRLKTIPAGKLLVDESTGETLIGPAKRSKTSYKVSLSK